MKYDRAPGRWLVRILRGLAYALLAGMVLSAIVWLLRGLSEAL
jgi:hypothetical protein